MTIGDKICVSVAFVLHTYMLSQWLDFLPKDGFQITNTTFEASSRMTLDGGVTAWAVFA